MTVCTPSKSGMRLLVAEDNPVNSALVGAMLDMLEYLDVAYASTGLEAVDVFKEQQCDLILMDCHMPEMDGYEATRTIRTLEAASASNHGHKPAIIIAMTGDALHDNEELCRESGMDDFLPKPFTVDSLKMILQRWLTIQSLS